MSKYKVPTNKVEVDVTKYIINDFPFRKMVNVLFLGTQIYLTLWKDEEYVAAGDYTQDDVDARITELLGEDPAATLSSIASSRQ